MGEGNGERGREWGMNRGMVLGNGFGEWFRGMVSGNGFGEWFWGMVSENGFGDLEGFLRIVFVEGIV